MRPLARLVRRESSFGVTIATTALFLFFGKAWLGDLSTPGWFAFVLVWLFAVILSAAFAILRHAEALAETLGEPLGTLVLTLSVIGIEVAMISAVMLTGDGKPALARDTMFAVVMIVLNGMVGLSLVWGGLRHHEQEYNLQGANAFLALIVPLAVLGLVFPNYTRSSPGPTLSRFHAAFLSIISVGIYGLFLVIQNWRHRDYFVAPRAHTDTPGPPPDAAHHGDLEVHPVSMHLTLLVMYLVPLVVLAKQIAVPIDYGIRVLGAPATLGGFLVATLILSPESLSATRAAIANDLQRSINILLGSVLASISLTIPAVLTIGLLTRTTIVLGLDAVDTILLVLTLGMSTLTFSSTRTNVLLGAVHLLLFLAYLMMMFER
jgi:Ca2+:H+ antiporter